MYKNRLYDILIMTIKYGSTKQRKIKYYNTTKKFLLKKLDIKNITDIDVALLKQLKENLKTINDTRQQSKITYKIWDIIICVIVATFADVYDWEDIEMFVKYHYKWFKSFLQMTGGVATYQTYENVFAIINSKELEKILVSF